MANNFQLQRVVAFDQTNEPVRAPLDSWRISYDRKRRSFNLANGNYEKTYDLRSTVFALMLVGERKKIAIGKTLGKLALSGFAGGKSGAAWDLRITGLSKDSVGQFTIVFTDTTVVNFEIDANDMEEFTQPIPAAAMGEEPTAQARALISRIKQMTEDGDRVLAELNEELLQTQNDIDAARELATIGRSFDERSAAKERLAGLEAALESKTYQRNAVDYALRVRAKPNLAAIPAKTKLETHVPKTEENDVAEPKAVAKPAVMARTAIAPVPHASVNIPLPVMVNDQSESTSSQPSESILKQPFSARVFFLKSLGLTIGGLIGLFAAACLQTGVRGAFVSLVLGGAIGLAYAKKKLR